MNFFLCDTGPFSKLYHNLENKIIGNSFVSKLKIYCEFFDNCKVLTFKSQSFWWSVQVSDLYYCSCNFSPFYLVVKIYQLIALISNKLILIIIYFFNILTKKPKPYLNLYQFISLGESTDEILLIINNFSKLISFRLRISIGFNCDSFVSTR